MVVTTNVNTESQLIQTNKVVMGRLGNTRIEQYNVKAVGGDITFKPYDVLAYDQTADAYVQTNSTITEADRADAIFGGDVSITVSSGETKLVPIAVEGTFDVESLVFANTGDLLSTVSAGGDTYKSMLKTQGIHVQDVSELSVLDNK